QYRTADTAAVHRHRRGRPAAAETDGFERRAIVTGDANVSSVLEKAVRRPRQAEIFPHRRACLFAAEEAAPLQFGNDLIDEIVEAAGQIRKHDRKTVGAFGLEPFLHL